MFFLKKKNEADAKKKDEADAKMGCMCKKTCLQKQLGGKWRRSWEGIGEPAMPLTSGKEEKKKNKA